MEVSFKFNNGESGAEMVNAILSLFGHSVTERIGNVSRTVTSSAPAPTISHADNPATGADVDEGATSTATHDAAGVPWDGRIHSAKKSMTDKGLWRKMKGVQDTTVAAVMRELQAAGKIMQPAPAAVPAAAPAAPQPVAVVPAGPGATAIVISPAAAVPQPMPAAIPPAPPLPVAAPVETPYQRFVAFIASHLQSPANPAGRVSEAWVSQSLQSFGIVDPAGNGSMQALEKEPVEKVVAVHNAFASALGAPGV